MRDGTLSALHFGDMARAPDMLFLHANGFNGLAYRSLLEPLAEQLGIHIISLDLRGHGHSIGFDNQPKVLRNFSLLAEDVGQFLQQYIDRPLLISGHSLGAVIGMLAARQIAETGQMAEKVNGYLGFDPVTVPGIVRLLPHLPGGVHLLINSLDWAKGAGRRRAEFDSLDDAFAYYGERGTFKFLPAEVTRDYLEGGTVENEAGIKLSCDPLWEQAIYGAQANDVFGAIKALPQNSRIVFAGKKPASTPLTRAKAARIMGKDIRGDDKVSFRPDYSHFFPLIRQDDTRELIKKALLNAKD